MAPGPFSKEMPESRISKFDNFLNQNPLADAIFVMSPFWGLFILGVILRCL
jgi:hypothetical protein